MAPVPYLEQLTFQLIEELAELCVGIRRRLVAGRITGIQHAACGVLFAAVLGVELPDFPIQDVQVAAAEACAESELSMQDAAAR